MSEKEFEIRKDGKPYMQVAESEPESLDTLIILEEYPYIQKAMDGENYELENLFCMVFSEILFENKVVGFATYDIRNNLEMIMTECYILPEFRGKRLFFDEICKMHFAAPRFGIMQPTCNVIELLLNYAFAKYATDDIVVSAIDLYLDPFDVKSDKSDEILSLQVPPSNFYDAGICSTLFVHDGEVFYHDLLENDKKRGIKRKKLDKGYFSNIKELFSKNRKEYGDLIAELKDELPDNRLGYDVIVGYGEGLSDYMQGMVDREVITYDNAISIKAQLMKEYESGKIDDKTIEDRFDILMLENTKVEEGDFAEFREFLNSQDVEGTELEPIKELVDLIGDNEEVGNNFLNALLDGDGEEIQNIISGHLENLEPIIPEFLDSLDDDLEDDDSVREFVMENIENKYRLDDNNCEYESSDYMMEIYLVLESLEYGDNYYDALNDVYLESLTPLESLTNHLSDEGYIEKDGIIEVDWDNMHSHEPYLRKILRDNNLETDGSQKELLQRLSDNNVNLGDSYKITPKGKNYLKELAWIGYFREFFDEFDFIDFRRYLDSYNGNIKEISLKYLDEHLKLASKINDEFYFEECMYVKNAIMDEADEFLSDLNNPE